MHDVRLSIYLCLPKNLEDYFDEKLKKIFKRFGKFRFHDPRDGVYKNIPHITLLQTGYCCEHLEDISRGLKKLSKKHTPFIVKSKGIQILKENDEFHVVFEVIKSKEIMALHESVYHELNHLAEMPPPHSLENFLPHLTIIASLPGQIAKKIKKIDIKDFKFEAHEIGIKLTHKGKKSRVYKKFKLLYSDGLQSK